MRDYSNIPVLMWQNAISAKKAMAQVRHEEPLIIQMPDDFNMDIDISICGCSAGKSPEHHLNCHVKNILEMLADKNQMPELAELANVAHTAGQVMDIETDNLRLIIHD
ncbi:MAG TPA: hypothetical protein ENJ08_06675 [Gammaproteobacteria bacterium]|nr:hypothetical protein [Gammaproteobacteria bacterium]